MTWLKGQDHDGLLEAEHVHVFNVAKWPWRPLIEGLNPLVFMHLFCACGEPMPVPEGMPKSLRWWEPEPATP